MNYSMSTPNIEDKTGIPEWKDWSEEVKKIPFKSTIRGVGDGEQRMALELATPLLGQNSPYDMMPVLNGILTKCDVKKLDKQNDFNTGKDGRDVLRNCRSRLTELFDSIKDFQNSTLFTSDEKTKIEYFKEQSPDEIAVGTLLKLEELLKILHSKKIHLLAVLPTVPVSACGQTTDMRIEDYYTFCQNYKRDFPSEFTSYIETIKILHKMDHEYINNPGRLMEELHSLVGKLFTDIKPIIVHEEKGYFILDNIDRIKFYRITRGHPRFKVIF